MVYTERTKPTDSCTEREIQGLAYSFALVNVFWDRTDVYFDNTTIPGIERTKPSDGETERTKPTDSWTERTKPTNTATERTKPT